jgi:hypothetical protein
VQWQVQVAGEPIVSKSSDGKKALVAVAYNTQDANASTNAYQSWVSVSAIPVPVNLVVSNTGEYSQAELDQAVAAAVAAAEATKDEIISQKEQVILELNTTIDAMYTQEEMENAVSTAKIAERAR